MLTPVPGQNLPSRGSNKLIYFDCSCGRKNNAIKWKYYTLGHTKTCGKCGLKPVSFWENSKFGKLKLKEPIETYEFSNKKADWVCDCGNTTRVQINLVTTGNTNSCGKCNVHVASYWENSKFGKLKLKTPINIHKFSGQKADWVCDCGREANIIIHNVTRGLQKTCGKCNLLSAEDLANKKFGKLKIKTPTVIDLILNTEKPIRTLCLSCGNEYKPVLNNVRLCRSLTCGCSSKISSSQIDIANFIKSFGVGVVSEYKIDGLKYDIFVPDVNLLIEYNGLKCHSMPESKKRDIFKYQNALNNDFDYIMIFGDEWLRNKQKVKNYLINRLCLGRPKSVRPSKCSINNINSDLVNEFYEKFHYIGAVKAKINYGVFFDGRLIACVSFKRPTRQSKYDYELIRMASDPEFRIHGIWSKIIKQFLSNNECSSIVSFSDNRLFSGKVYEKIGFKFDGEIRPDYYWVKGNRRFHKSGLRKKDYEKTSGFTEYQLRESQGYSRIWDLGKKRWVFDCNQAFNSTI